MDSSNPTLQAQPVNLTLDDWHQQYWFTPLHMIEVINPAWAKDGESFITKDFPFMVEMRHFLIKAGESKDFPGVIANVYLDQMSRILAQNDEKLGYMGDPNLRRLYYDKLIVTITNMAPEADTTPSYLKTAEPSQETPPWQSGDQNTSVVAGSGDLQKTIPPPKAEAKEFELEGTRFKQIVDKNGSPMFYKNGKLTSETEYAKAASML